MPPADGSTAPRFPPATVSGPPWASASSDKSARASRIRPDPPRPVRSRAASSDAGSSAEMRSSRTPLTRLPAAVAHAANPPRVGGKGHPGQRAYDLTRARSLQRLELEPRRLLHLRRGDLFDRLRERPVMALEVDCHVGAVAVELVSGLHRDFRAALTRTLAMIVKTAGQPYVHALRVAAANRFRTLGPSGELSADHDDSVIMGHLRMHDVVLGVGKHFAWLEAEGLLQPFQRSAIVLIDNRGNECGSSRCRGGHESSMLINMVNSYQIRKSYAREAFHNAGVVGSSPSLSTIESMR